MTINSTVNLIRSSLKDGHVYNNEASISQGIVLPLLNILDWPVFDTRVVAPEYSIEGRRVDFALCNPPRKPIVFVEVKKIGLAEGADKQLFEYAFHKGVPLAVLTDGREWHFYLPSGEGDYVERRIYKLDLIERSTDDAVYYLSRYLKYENIKSGEAIEAAKKDYQDKAQKRKIKETLPLAWDRLLEEKDEILIELLAEKTEDLCGYRPKNNICANFFTEIKNRSFEKHQKNKHDAKRPPEKRTANFPNRQDKPDLSNKTYYELSQLITADIGGSKPQKLRIQNEEIEVRNWSDLSIKFISWLVNNNYLNFQKVPIYNAAMRDKYFVNNRPEHANTSKDGSWSEVNGFFVDTKYSTKMHIKNILATLQQLRIENLSIKISF